MSVLIRGMNMPRNCLMCQFHGFGGHKNEFIVCSLTGRSEGQLSNVPDCPLVEVPTPHGRLIDAEKLFKKGINLDWSLQKWVSEVDIGLMPTIIEAEEGEGHEQN